MEKLFAILTRPRYILFAFLLIAVPALDLLTDTEGGFIDNIPFGASLLVYLVLLGRATLAVLTLHWLISYIFDSANLDLVKLAEQHPEQRGLYLVAMGLFAIAFAIVIQSVLSI